MAATAPSTSLVPIQPVFTDAERLALAGYLAGYRGLTREAYTLDLRQFTLVRTRVITRKGGKVVTIPHAPRTARAIDLAIGERAAGRCSPLRTGGGWTGTAPPGSSAG